MPDRPKTEKVYRGIPVSSGVGIGPLFSCNEGVHLDAPAYRVGAHQVADEVARVARAIDVVKADLDEIRRRVEPVVGENDARMLLVPLQLLEDPTLQGQIASGVEKDLINAEAAVSLVVQRWGRAFENLQDPLARDRASDLRDVGRRLVAALRGADGATMDGPDEPYVLVTRELYPSDAAKLDRTRLAGIITEVGGRASHTAILARALGIPAVTGIRDVKALLDASGRVAVVDGSEGEVVLDPTVETVDRMQQHAGRLERVRLALEAEPAFPAVTTDGVEVDILLNVENAAEILPDDLGGLAGVGLYRTEFVYMDRPMFPSEDEQYEVYRAVCERAGDLEVVFRTIDIGGDKKLPYFKVADEDNPALGWRGFRISDEWPDLFIAQIRALLRASAHGRVRIMLPMITTVEEVRRARAIVTDVRADLVRREIPIAAKVPLGVMVEVPAAVLAIDQVVKEVDFLSIGSNDLIQYLLAVDRNNARVARLSEPLHPSVLRAIKMVIRAGANAGKPVSLCGEMAGSVFHTMVLLGMGLRRFSMARRYTTGVGRLIRAVSIKDAEETARRALTFATTSEVKSFLRSRTREVFRDLNIPFMDGDEAS